MTMSAFAGWPGDPDGVDDNYTDTFGEFDRFGGFGGFNKFGRFNDDPPDGPNGLVIEFAIELGTARLGHLYTRGLWWLGIPELCLSPPTSYHLPAGADWGQLACFLGARMIELGRALIVVDHFDVPAQQGELDGRQVRIWLAGQAPPEGPVAIALGPEVDTVIRVDCSLWSSAPAPGPSR